jgi:hypothetical protein
LESSFIAFFLNVTACTFLLGFSTRSSMILRPKPPQRVAGIDSRYHQVVEIAMLTPCSFGMPLGNVLGCLHALNIISTSVHVSCLDPENHFHFCDLIFKKSRVAFLKYFSLQRNTLIGTVIPLPYLYALRPHKPSCFHC